MRTRPLRDARQWGYQRVVAGKAVLQFDAAPPPLARHARHGCASTLAFELSHAAAAADRQLRRRGLRRRAGAGADRARAARHRRAFDAGARRRQFDRGAGQRQARRRASAKSRSTAARCDAEKGGSRRHPARGEPRRLCRALRPGPSPHPDPARRRHRAARRGPAGARRAQGQARQSAFAVRFHLGPGVEVSALRRRARREPGAGRRQLLAVRRRRRRRSKSTKACGSTARAARTRSSSW